MNEDHDSLVQPDHRRYVDSRAGVTADPNSQALAAADAIADAQRAATEAERARCLGKVRKEMARGRRNGMPRNPNGSHVYNSPTEKNRAAVR